MYISGMTTLKVIVEDDEAEALKRVLLEMRSVKSVEEEKQDKAQTAYERIKTILDNAKGKNLFAEIEDPSEWQRQIRKEWERDF